MGIAEIERELRNMRAKMGEELDPAAVVLQAQLDEVLRMVERDDGSSSSADLILGGMYVIRAGLKGGSRP